MRYFYQFLNTIKRVVSKVMTGHFWAHIWILISLCVLKRAHSKLHLYDKPNVATLYYYSTQIYQFRLFSNDVTDTEKAESCSIYNWNWLLGRSLVSHIYLLSPFGKKEEKGGCFTVAQWHNEWHYLLAQTTLIID